MTSNDIKKIACAKWGRYKVKGPFTSPLKFYRGIEMQSMLGKQNVPATITETITNNLYINPKSDGTFTNNLDGTIAKKVNYISGHKYAFVLCKNKLALDFVGADYFYIRMYYDGALEGTYREPLTHYDTTNYEVQTFNIDITKNAGAVLRYGGPIKSDVIAKGLVILDLTEMGLDTLTAQQFYDQYNHLFDQLANGEIINKAITFNPSPAITLSSGDYWFNQTGKTSNQTLGSLLLPKGITKITDANGVEVEFE